MRFGSFVVDTRRRQLTREGAAVHLTPKAFELLALLASEAPRVLTKQELHERLWPATFVSDATLVGVVKEVRRALGDRDERRPIIRTVHRVGYAIGVEVTTERSAEEALAWHWLVLRRRRVALRDGENLVGRDPVSHVCIDAAGVSRRHARIVIDGGGVRLEDLGSKNGTVVGEARVATAVVLHDGDRIAFGSVVGIYRTSRAGMSTETASRSAVRSNPARLEP